MGTGQENSLFSLMKMPRAGRDANFETSSFVLSSLKWALYSPEESEQGTELALCQLGWTPLVTTWCTWLRLGRPQLGLLPPAHCLGFH